MDEYNFTHRGVTCVAVDWERLEFYFSYKNSWWIYPQSGWISKSSDIDHIITVIDKFIEFMQKNRGQKVPDWS